MKYIYDWIDLEVLFDMNIFLWILVFIGGVTGALSTLYIVVSLFAVIFYKIYRKTKYHASLYD